MVQAMKLKNGYLQGKRIDMAYRGFKFWRWDQYFSLKPINIGSTKLYVLGPLALFVRPKR